MIMARNRKTKTTVISWLTLYWLRIHPLKTASGNQGGQSRGPMGWLPIPEASFDFGEEPNRGFNAPEECGQMESLVGGVNMVSWQGETHQDHGYSKDPLHRTDGGDAAAGPQENRTGPEDLFACASGGK
jgi:hypothetical protein